jgi:hypothetical protein
VNVCACVYRFICLLECSPGQYVLQLPCACFALPLCLVSLSRSVYFSRSMFGLSWFSFLNRPSLSLSRSVSASPCLSLPLVLLRVCVYVRVYCDEPTRDAFLVADQERHGGAGLRVSPMAGIADCGNLLTRAGFSLPTGTASALRCVVRCHHLPCYALWEHVNAVHCTPVHLWTCLCVFSFCLCVRLLSSGFGCFDGELPGRIRTLR